MADYADGDSARKSSQTTRPIKRPLVLWPVRAVALTVGFLFVWAALAKTFSPSPALSFLEFLGAHGVLGRVTLSATASIEFGIGCALLGRPFAAVPRVIAAAMLLLFLLPLLAAIISKDAPACGCLGLVRVFESNRHEALLGIARNLLLAGGLLLLSPPRGRESSARLLISPT